MAFKLFSDVLKVKNAFLGVSPAHESEVDFVGGYDYCVRKHDLC